MSIAPIPKSIVSFKDIDAGAPNPVRVKFMSGYNSGVRSVREGKLPLEGIPRASRSVPFLAGYDAARIDARLTRLDTTQEVTASMDKAWRVYVSAHTGTDLAWDAKLVSTGDIPAN